MGLGADISECCPSSLLAVVSVVPSEYFVNDDRGGRCREVDEIVKSTTARVVEKGLRQDVIPTGERGRTIHSSDRVSTCKPRIGTQILFSISVHFC